MANIRIQNKSDKQVNWEKAINFVPLKGEIIIYEKDENYSYDRIKLGDGVTKVNDLPFAGSDFSGTILYTPQTLTEEQQTQARINIGAVSEEDVIDIIANGTEPQINATGELIEFNFEKEMPITVISKIHRDSTWGLSNELTLHQVKGNNVADFTAYLGGAGTVFEKNGLTATINDNSTLTVQGTNTSTGWTSIISVTRWTGEHSARIYPAGTYTIPSDLTIAVRAATYPDNETTIPGATGNLSGTITISEPFRIVSIRYIVKGGTTVDTTVPLGLFRGRSIPKTDYEYCGNIYTITFDQPVYDGEFNWTTGELKDIDGNTIGYYETPDIVGLEGDNHFWTGFGENTITNLQEKEKTLVQLNETVPEGSMPSICDFEFKPTTPLCIYDLSNTNIMPNQKFNGREIPFLTTKGNLIVTDKDQNIKINKYIDSLININRDGWNLSDKLTQNGVEKVWSKKFYITKDEYASREDFEYGAVTNSLYTFEFDESDFAETGIPAKLDNIPVATPCFYTGTNVDGWLPYRIYGGQPFPLKFSYNQETGKYIMTIRGFGAGLIFYQLTGYSKTYIYYQLETPYVEKDFFAMGLEEGDTILFENDYSYIQEYLDTNGFFHSLPSGGNVTDSNTTPTISAVVPQNVKEALNGFNNTARILNEKQKASEEASKDYSWIGDGDGSTDYTSLIQNKIDELNMFKGGIVYLGNGTYNITKSLIIYENISIIGTGDTIINQTSDKTHGIIISGSNINIEGLTIKLSGNCDGTTEHVLSKDFDSEIIGCIYVNSSNRKTDANFDDRYPKNLYCQHVTIKDVTLLGTYGFKWEGNYQLYPDNKNTYKGCGIVGGKMFFNYLFADNIRMKGLYCGYYGTGGSNIVNLFCTDCKIMVYDLGGGYNNFDIKGHSSYGPASDTETTAISDIVVYSNGENNNYNVQVYDSQWFEYLLYFDGCSMNNKYNTHYFSGGYHGLTEEINPSLGRIKFFVYNIGRGNVNVSPYVNEPFHTGSVRYNLSGQSEFKDVDTILYNVLAGAGIWGNISTTNSVDETRLSLANVCRYPNNDHLVGSYILFNETPSIENPIEIIIDVSNRPAYAFPNIFIQFHHEYVASDFSITWYTSHDDQIRTANVKDNTNIAYFYNLNQAGYYNIHKIKITITKALNIPELKYRSSNYTQYIKNYNENNKVGIVNIGMVGDTFGRSFLGECGGSLYGNLDMKNNVISNLDTPINNADAANKEYVDSSIGDIETALENIITKYGLGGTD